jgi:hypothetical protein
VSYNLYPGLKKILEDKRLCRFGVPANEYEEFLKAEQFVVDLRGFSEEEKNQVIDTYNDLVEMGLDKLPYEKCVIHSLRRILHNDGVPIDKPYDLVQSYYFFKEGVGGVCALFPDQQELLDTLHNCKTEPRFIKEIQSLIVITKMNLVVSLATRNIIKERHEPRKPINRLTGLAHKRGSGGYTLIRPPESHEIEGGHSGIKVRPHFRRGHIRKLDPDDRARWIWVSPCFINGEPEIARKAYLVTS